MSQNAIGRLKEFVVGRKAVVSRVLSHPVNRGSKFHAIRDYVIWNTVRFSVDARHVLSMPGGIEIIVGPRENYATTIYTHALPDFMEMLFLAHFMGRDDVFADVGANGGMYSIWVAGATGARAIAVEPVPDTFTTLRKNVRLNDFEALIEIVRTAVGDSAGEVFMTTGEGGMNHIVESKSGEKSVLTTVRRLDDILGDRCPTAIKIDVEGFEMHVLRGAPATLSNKKLKAVIIELQNQTLNRYGANKQEFYSVFESYGFQPCSYDPLNRTISVDSQRNSLNELFLRSDDPEIRARLQSGPKIPLPGYPNGL